MKKKYLIILSIIMLLIIIGAIIHCSISNRAINNIVLKNETLYSIEDVIYLNSQGLYEDKEINSKLQLIAEDLKENCPGKSFYIESYEVSSTNEWFFAHEFINNVVIDKPRLIVTILEDNSIKYNDFYRYDDEPLDGKDLKELLHPDSFAEVLTPTISLGQAQEIVKKALNESSPEYKKIISTMQNEDSWTWNCRLYYDGTLIWDIRESIIGLIGNIQINAKTGAVIDCYISDGVVY